jgi:hypothetical protein
MPCDYDAGPQNLGRLKDLSDWGKAKARAEDIRAPPDAFFLSQLAHNNLSHPLF